MDDSSNLFFLMWDCNGLESCIDVSHEQAIRVFPILRGDTDIEPFDAFIGKTLGHMRIRAMANPQRHYEIYSITTARSITKEMLIGNFEKNPQMMADLIREKGIKIYSDRRISDCKII